jgi:Mg-chelatase subunit ChlI
MSSTSVATVRSLADACARWSLDSGSAQTWRGRIVSARAGACPPPAKTVPKDALTKDAFIEDLKLKQRAAEDRLAALRASTEEENAPEESEDEEEEERGDEKHDAPEEAESSEEDGEDDEEEEGDYENEVSGRRRPLQFAAVTHSSSLALSLSLALYRVLPRCV